MGRKGAGARLGGMLLVLFFTWVPSLLLHRQVSRRDLLPGAVLTAVGLVVITIISRYVIEPWVNLYAKDYGGLGVVLAIYFWIAFYSIVIVGAASLAPGARQRSTALRRNARQAKRVPRQAPAPGGARAAGRTTARARGLRRAPP